MNVMFLSDLHLGHTNCAKWRGFESVDEMDETIYNNIMSRCSKRSTLYLLGDTIFDRSNLWMIEDISRTLNGNLKLVMGNHDFERADAPSFEELSPYLASVHGLVKYKEFWLSHAPIHPGSLRGKINLHGHTHDSKIQDERYFNVCCDVHNYTPIDLQEIRKRIKNGEI